MQTNLTRRSIFQLTGAGLALPVIPSNLLESGPMPFTPKFADLVRNIATVTGTGPVTIGQAVSGFTSLSDAVGSGEQFYYSLQGVDKPQEREVGRGTMQSDGRVARQAINGSPTNFTTGAKTIALVAPAEWFERQEDAMLSAATRAELAARAGGRAYLAESGGTGTFLFDPSDLSALVSADPRQGLFVAPASDPSGANGAWVRSGWHEIDPRWFGALADNATDASPAINAAFRLAEELAVTGSVNPSIYRGGPAISLGVGKFFCASSLEPLATLRIQGAGGLGWGAATQLRFPAGVTAIRAQAYNTSGATTLDGVQHFSGDALVVQDIYFIGGFANGAEAEAHGVHAKRAIHLERCTFDNFEGDGLYAYTIFGGGAPNEGNTNVLRATNCVVANCRSGTRAQGADANAWTLVGCSFMNNRRWGSEERGFLGNHNYGHHYDGNARTSWNSGAAGRPCSYVHYNGNWYFAIEGQEAGASVNAPSGTTADNAWWGYWQAGGASVASGVPTWSNGIAVRSGGPILQTGLNNASTFTGCHLEINGVSQLDQGGIIIGGSQGTVVKVTGGVLTRNRVSSIHSSSEGLVLGGRVEVRGDLNAPSPTNIFGPQSGVTADCELRLHNTNVASVIKGYSWPSGVSSGEIWVSYAGINGMILRGQQKVRFDIGGIEQCSVGPSGFDLVAGKVYKVNGTQVVGARKPGWEAATGAATRSTFDTSTVTVTQLAERVKALIDDLHDAAGHGLIGS